MISIETKQQILDAARIEEVVGDFVILKKRGTNLLGLCPFHNEKTPSFIVSPVKGIFKCFGCSKGGDSVSFLMEHEQFSYPEALRYLARKYNITIEEEEQSEEQIQKLNERETLFKVSEFAASCFKKSLWESQAGQSVGLPYFRERGFSDPTIEAFSLGYCLDTWDSFTKEALHQSYSIQSLVESGLTIEKEEKVYDRFRGRVMFPIQSLSGRVIGFGGRVLGTDKTKAKYVNSPESPIYSKSQVLYGIYQAKREIIAKDMAYLVEGYTDVISLHQAGIVNVVASSGTSLTQDQIKLVSRFTRNITILYDGDPAGIKASFRGINMLLEKGLNVRVVLFPDNHDPDSFSRSHTGEEVAQYLSDQAMDFIRFKTQLLLKEVGEDPIKRAELIENIVESIALIPEEIYRSVYIQECSRILHIEEPDLISRLNKLLRAQYRLKIKQDSSDFLSDPSPEVTYLVNESVKHSKVSDELEQERLKDEVLEKELLRLLLYYGRETTLQTFMDENGTEIEEAVSVGIYLVREMEEDDLLFENPLHQKILQIYKDHVLRDYIPVVEDFMQMEDGDLKKIMVDIGCSPYEISPLWELKNIRVKTEKEPQKLNQTVFETMVYFKLRKIEKLTSLLENQMKQCHAEDVEALLGLMRQRKQLDEIKKILSEKIRRVIS